MADVQPFPVPLNYLPPVGRAKFVLGVRFPKDDPTRVSWRVTIKGRILAKGRLTEESGAVWAIESVAGPLPSDGTYVCKCILVPTAPEPHEPE